MNVYKCDNGWEYWYDRSQGGNWWCAKFDAEGNQIGDAQFAYNRKEIIMIVLGEIEEENGVNA